MWHTRIDGAALSALTGAFVFEKRLDVSVLTLGLDLVVCIWVYIKLVEGSL